MISSLQTYIEKEKLFFKKTDKIVLTVSGGIDSVVMSELFHQAGFKFGIAHCNFQLRSEESDADEIFVEELAEKYNVQFHSATFNTAEFAKKNKLSIQVAARELRYQWFEEIREQYNYHYIATAHHQDDSIETFFINLVRGTGISGLHGILPKQGKIIRPLLFCTKNDISIFAKKNKLKHREDSSNALDKYARNKIRHHIIPVLKELNPSLEKTLTSDMERLRDTELIYKASIENKRAKIFKEEKGRTLISISQLKKLKPLPAYLYEFLKPYGFNETIVNEMIEAFTGKSGKRFYSSAYRLLKDREFLILEKINENLRSSIEVKKGLKKVKLGTSTLNFKTQKPTPTSSIPKSASIACLDMDKLSFPLLVRKWQQGDSFYPLGMKGKKKLSDFFIDKKLSISQKENTWLLTSDDKIAWIVGMRIDDRFKVTAKTERIYFAEFV